jgi:hypothetical protein
MMWAKIKKEIKGTQYNSVDELYNAISDAWENIPEDYIINLVGSFNARFRTVINLRGESLNGHWRDVHSLHHPVFGPMTEQEASQYN